MDVCPAIGLLARGSCRACLEGKFVVAGDWSETVSLVSES